MFTLELAESLMVVASGEWKCETWTEDVWGQEVSGLGVKVGEGDGMVLWWAASCSGPAPRPLSGLGRSRGAECLETSCSKWDYVILVHVKIPSLCLIWFFYVTGHYCFLGWRSCSSSVRSKALQVVRPLKLYSPSRITWIFIFCVLTLLST